MSKDSDQFWLGFDLGGTKILSSLFDREFYQVSRKRERIRGAEGKKAGMAAIVDLIHKTLDETTATPKQLGGICVGCPGPLDLKEGTIIRAPNLGWEDVKVRKILEREFGCTVTIINDVDAGVYGEYCFGSAIDARCVIGVFPGTGIGGGCVYEGEILRGGNSSCMEIGHMQVVPEGQRCGCGRHGCLETVASRLVISSRVAAAAYRGNAPYVYENFGTDLSNIRSGALADAIKAGDKVVQEIIEEAAAYLGRAIGDLVNLLNPEVVVLGGGLVEAMPKVILDVVEKSAKKRCMPAFGGSYKIVEAKLGDDATVMGAAAWAKANV